MRCPACNAKVAPSARFCSACGATIPLVCRACGTVNPSGEVSCTSCRAPLAPAGKPGAAHRKRRPARASEDRRQVTVLFCDLVGSTAMSERLDPENMRDVLLDYRKICEAAANRYGGRTVLFSGDGVLLSFGHPEAHEDDAVRAIHAGLQILRELRGLSERPRGNLDLSISARLAAHTGLVVAGDLGRGRSREGMALIGEAPNVAARLQAFAPSDGLVVSGETARLVEGLFRLRGLGSHALKGVGRAVAIFQVEGPSDAPNIFEARARRGLHPIVGRERELSWLAERWAEARGGKGQVALISGEPGMGKSRLIRDFRDRLRDDAATAILCYCSPYRGNSAFFPIVQQFECSLGLNADIGGAEKLDRLDKLLSDLGLRDPADAATLAAFLSIRNDGRYEPLSLSPRQLKARAMDIAVRIVAAMASRHPVVMVVEDVHWIDPSSLDYLRLLANYIPHLPVLLVISYRPEFKPPFGQDDHVHERALDRLPESASRELMASLLGGHTAQTQVQADILAKAEGVPLFLEELTSAVLEAGGSGTCAAGVSAEPARPSVPTSLRGSLLARLDRLGPARMLAQLAAAIGRRFDGRLLRAVATLSNEAYSAALDRLLEAQLVYRVDRVSELYEFKHALVQDAAYDLLLNRQRASHHREIALAMETLFPERTESEPEILAYHFTQGRLPERAAPLWNAAGQRALERAANIEALAYFDRALDCLASLPPSSARDQTELMLLVSRGVALTATRSYAAPEVGENYARAHKLCGRLGNAPQVFPVLHGLYRFYLVRAELQMALRTADQLLAMAQVASDPRLRMEAHQAYFFSYGFSGRLTEAQRHCDECIALFAPETLQGRLHLYSTDTAASVLCLASLVGWLRGHPDRAVDMIGRALSRAREVDHPYTVAWTLNFSAVIHQILGDAPAALRFADECIVHSSRHEFPFWLAGGRVMRCWAMIAEGEPGDGLLEEMGAALREWRGTGALVFSPYYLGCLVEAYRLRGRSAEMVGPLADAISDVERTGERWWEPELHRLRGEVLRETGRGRPGEAEACFERALQLAERAGSRSLQLRAAMSLARLWSERGSRRSACDLVSGARRFVDGRAETPELRVAAELVQAWREVSPTEGTDGLPGDRNASTRLRTSARSPLV